MKCPQCNANHKHKEGMRCKCGYAFALDPKIDKFSDGKFLKAIRSASANDTRYYTKNMLYGAVVRQATRKSCSPIFVIIMLIVTAVVLVVARRFVFIPIVLTVIAILAVLGDYFRKPMPWEQFDKLLRKWQHAKKETPKLIEQPALGAPPPDWPEADIYNYGVEGVLIVDRDLTVDLFVLNGVHAEQRLLVLSESGYPHYIVPLAQRCLDDNPQLKVFLLHDAEGKKLSMRQRMATTCPLRVSDDRFVDLGISIEDARRIKKLKSFQVSESTRYVPVEWIPFTLLTLATAEAVAEGVGFTDLLEKAEQQKAAGDSGGGSFG
jgi:hypothetical protein